MVRGREFGPWPDPGSALAGYETEQRRAEKFARMLNEHQIAAAAWADRQP